MYVSRERRYHISESGISSVYSSLVVSVSWVDSAFRTNIFTII